MTKRARPVDLAKLWLVTEKVAPVDDAAVDDLEASLDTAMPAGYRALVTRAGEGAYAMELRVHAPDGVRKTTAAHRKSQSFSPANAFWTNHADALRGIDPASLVVLASSYNGDQIAFARGKPDRLLLFPRHHDRIADAGRTLEAALATFARGGVLGNVFRFDCYDTEIDRVAEVWTAAPDDEGRSIDDLVEVFVDALAPDHDDGDDPPLAFWFRCLQGSVHLRDTHQWVDGKRAPLELLVRRDRGAGSAWKAIASTLAEQGFRVAKRAQR